jgi:hypothetical protein
MNITDLMNLCKEANIIKDGKIEHELKNECVFELQKLTDLLNEIKNIISQYAEIVKDFN